jgi:hypothetical protein
MWRAMRASVRCVNHKAVIQTFFVMVGPHRQAPLPRLGVEKTGQRCWWGGLWIKPSPSIRLAHWEGTLVFQAFERGLIPPATHRLL